MTERERAILIVDDEASQRRLLGGFLAALDFRVREAASAEEALESLTSEPAAMILLDVRLPGISGIDALPAIRKEAPSTPILLITAYADLRQAVSAIKLGADDYLSKPIDLDELKVAVFDGLGLSLPGSGKTSLPALPPEFICESRAMRQLVETVAVVAPSDAPVLILGKSGTGKELVARLIHNWSTRSAKPLVTANCAGLSETLIESELFGHARGAFTGASQERRGLFRTAAGGTLFLDEIGEMPLALQPKLLRALETRQVTPVGADLPVDVDARLVAATNRDLLEAVRQGRFREDLYYRINVVELAIPPLAQRREDIIPLARHFASQYAGRPVRFSPQATQALLAHGWTGNVRELRNAIQRACLLSRGDVILPEHLPGPIQLKSSAETDGADTNRLSQVERATILSTLQECGGNRTQAAKRLGISRRTLIYKLRDLEADGG